MKHLLKLNVLLCALSLLVFAYPRPTSKEPLQLRLTSDERALLSFRTEAESRGEVQPSSPLATAMGNAAGKLRAPDASWTAGDRQRYEAVAMAYRQSFTDLEAAEAQWTLFGRLRFGAWVGLGLGIAGSAISALLLRRPKGPSHGSTQASRVAA